MRKRTKILLVALALLVLVITVLLVSSGFLRSPSPAVSTTGPATPQRSQSTRVPRGSPPVAPESPTAVPTAQTRPTESSAQAQAMPSPTPDPTPTPSPFPTFPPAPLPDDMAILLLGTDKNVAEDRSWHTDSIIVLAVRPKEKRVGLMSIPRDLWVMIPGRGYERINTADFLGEYFEYPGGGPALLQETIEDNLGIATSNFVRVNIEGLRQIVDALEYVTIQVETPVEDWFLDPDAPDGIRHSLIPAGTQTLDGQAVVDYARSRRNCNDFQRARRQQQVLRAIGKRALQLDVIPRARELWTALNQAFETDLTWGEIVGLLPLMAEINPGEIRSEVIDYDMASDWTTAKGAQVLLPDRAAIERAWRMLLVELTPTPVP